MHEMYVVSSEWSKRQYKENCPYTKIKVNILDKRIKEMIPIFCSAKPIDSSALLCQYCLN